MKNSTAKSLNRTLYIIILVILAITALVSAYFCYSLNKKSIEMVDNKEKAISTGQKIEALSKVAINFGNLKDEEEDVTEYLPEEKEVETILVDLESMAREESLSFLAYQGNKAAKTKIEKGKKFDIQITQETNYKYFEAELSLQGSFGNVNNFIKKIEDYPRLVRIVDIGYNKQSADAQSDVVIADIKIRIYLK